MNNIPTITEQDIRNIIDPASFQRGQTYYNSDAIFNTRQQGMALKARCQGSRSQAYRVEVAFNNAGIVSNQCSCPLGGHCKHVAALLLTWIHDPEKFLEQPEVDQLLEQSTKAELISRSEERRVGKGVDLGGRRMMKKKKKKKKKNRSNKTTIHKD